MTDVTTGTYSDERRMIAGIRAHLEEVGLQRGRLRAVWMDATQNLDRAQRHLDVVVGTQRRWRTEVANLSTEFGVTSWAGNVPDRPGVGMIPQATTQAWLVPAEPGRQPFIRPAMTAAFERDVTAARESFRTARTRTFGGSIRKEGIAAMDRCALRIARLGELARVLEREVVHKSAARTDSARSSRREADQALAVTESLARYSASQLQAVLQPWDSTAWRSWPLDSAPFGMSQVYAGSLEPLPDSDLGDNSDFGQTTRSALHLSVRDNLEIVFDHSSRDQALSFARSLLLRTAAAVKPGELVFTLFDPVGLGQSAADLLGLAQYDAGLIDGKVWSSPADLVSRLVDLTAHMELVIQKYLVAEYETIDEFNQAAGEIAEPYRLLVLFDFPQGLTEESAGRLNSVLRNGPRCGVYTLILRSMDTPASYGVDTEQMSLLTKRLDLSAPFVTSLHGYDLRMRLLPELDTGPGETVADKIIETVGRGSAGRTKSAVTFTKVFGLYRDAARRRVRPELSLSVSTIDPEDETTWWRENTVHGLHAPIGQKGARDVAILGFDSGNHTGAILVGRPGSGKSTLLHAYLNGLTTLYGPTELELYLIDFREGVEFKSYAAGALPHARVVAIESEREFGLSVLRSIEAEMTQRGSLLRDTGGQQAGLESYRSSGGSVLPRILLVFDEFQALFDRTDQIGIAAAQLLEKIIRQGRGFGVHVLLASQSLAGLDALGSHVLRMLPVRIVLPVHELEAQLLLGDHNDGARHLTGSGDGILNRAAGAVAANERFQGSLIPESDRAQRLTRMRAKADREGFHRRPTVFEGNQASPLDALDPSRFAEEMASSGTAAIRMRLGTPMTISGAVDATLSREAGSNLLAIMRDGEAAGAGLEPASGPAYGLLTACVASASQSAAGIDIIDFMSTDDNLDTVLAPFLDTGRITLRRSRAFPALVQQLREEVHDRIDQDDTTRPARIAFLFGIHRARQLQTSFDSMDADATLTESLEEILRDGPEFGIHLWLWADTVSGVTRRLTSSMIRECGWRVAGKMSPDDSAAFIATEKAAGIRDLQLVLTNDDTGISTQAISFALPSDSWLRTLLGATP